MLGPKLQEVQLDEDWQDWVNNPRTEAFIELLRDFSRETLESIKYGNPTDERTVGASIGIDSIVEGFAEFKARFAENEKGVTVDAESVRDGPQEESSEA